MGITKRGPQRSIKAPITGLKRPEAIKPMEKVAAVTPRCQPNSSSISGNNRENDVRALTAMAMVTKATAITIQP